MITFILLLIVSVAIGGFLYKRYRIPPAVELPALALTDLQGHPVSLQSYAGYPLFINFFAMWCGPCMRELPQLAALKNKLTGQKLQVLCIADEPIDKLQLLQSKIGNGVTILHSVKPLHDIGIYTYPTNYIYNGKGMKVYEKVNPDDWEDDAIVTKINSLIAY